MSAALRVQAANVQLYLGARAKFLVSLQGQLLGMAAGGLSFGLAAVAAKQEHEQVTALAADLFKAQEVDASVELMIESDRDRYDNRNDELSKALSQLVEAVHRGRPEAIEFAVLHAEKALAGKL